MDTARRVEGLQDELLPSFVGPIVQPDLMLHGQSLQIPLGLGELALEPLDSRQTTTLAPVVDFSGGIQSQHRESSRSGQNEEKIVHRYHLEMACAAPRAYASTMCL